MGLYITKKFSILMVKISIFVWFINYLTRYYLSPKRYDAPVNFSDREWSVAPVVLLRVGELACSMSSVLFSGALLEGGSIILFSDLHCIGLIDSPW